MRKFILSAAILLICLVTRLTGQTLFVDPVKGSDNAKGSLSEPLASLEKAIQLAGGFTGNEPVIIKLNPGLYILKDKLPIKTGKASDDITSYTIESVTMPDDTAWHPALMPVISSVSGDNVTTQFKHATGMLVSKNNVHIKGLKFLGNANPAVKYYYPVNRDSAGFSGLEISQCYFIGDKNGAVIQGAIWVQGPDVKVDHCIFYGCKNALLLFKSIKDFSFTHSIIYGAYESAAWFGPVEGEFIFHNNVITDCNFFWCRGENTYPTYMYSNSIITNVKNYMGFYSRNGLIPADKNSHVEKGIKRSAKLMVSEVTKEGVPKDYLHLTPQSDGYDLKAGIFKK